MMVALSLARTGGAEIGELDQIARRLKYDVGDDDRWFDEWVEMSSKVLELAEVAEAKGRAVTASSHYKRTAAYAFVAERFRLPKDERAMQVYARGVDSFRKAMTLGDGPIVEFVEVPYEDGNLPGLFVHAQGSGEARPPVVVFFTGFDGNKELNWFWGIEDLVKRGVSCLSLDTPGVGEAIRFRGFYLRHDYEVAASASLDYLESRGDVDASRTAILAPSLGGYYASRAASMEPRFKACVAWGAQWDYHAVWQRRIAANYEAQLPVPGEHLMWSTNADSPEEALRRIDGFRLDGVVQKMRCPFLLCHGEDDQQIPVTDARRLYEAVGSDDKEIRIFTAEEGGAQHCHVDNLAVATPVMFDWVAERLSSLTPS
jgi:dipeptidyl aminopeptidase/acylaminoacyl peptidase